MADLLVRGKEVLDEANSMRTAPRARVAQIFEDVLNDDGGAWLGAGLGGGSSGGGGGGVQAGVPDLLRECLGNALAGERREQEEEVGLVRSSLIRMAALGQG